jgi:transmembrane sensor
MKDNISTYSSFLENKNFVQWRLLREEESEKYWLTFIKENPELEEEFNKAIVICDNIRINEKIFSDTDFLYQRILQSISIHRKNKQRRNVIYSLYAAASIALLLICTFRIFNPNTTSIPNEEIIGKTLPDEHITLMTGGKIITLNQDAKIQLDNGQMSYTDSLNNTKSIETGEVQNNKLVVPNGRRSSIILADGSEIWINSGTELIFPSTFNKKTREIYVEGEIYINVATLNEQPFVVRTPELIIKVYGTCFNVSAYKNDNEASVVLVSGSVEINTGDNHSVRMVPNEMATLKNGDLSTNTVDVSLYTSWVNGIFIFDGTPTSEMLKKVGRYYNISFDGETSLPDKKITGKLFLSENIDEVLSSISLLTSTEYKREGNIIRLINKERE